jgi:hypothetical protein
LRDPNNPENGFVVCVNFEQPRLLFFSDRIFKERLLQGPKV